MLDGMKAVVKGAKEVFDVVGDIPGVIAFLKIYGERLGERMKKDPRPQFSRAIYDLPPEVRTRIIHKLHNLEIIGKEDMVVWNLCKFLEAFPADEWPDILEALDQWPDQDFRQFVAALDDDKVRQAWLRFCEFVRRFGAPALAYIAPHIADWQPRLEAYNDQLRRDIEAEKRGWRRWTSLFGF